jgi:hypothetical protein
MQKVKAAMAKITTTFPKYYFSKQSMQYQQWQLTTKCNAFQGHAVEPMNIVFWTRYFNMVCNPSSPPAYAASIPTCVDLGDYTNTNSRCYGGAGANNKWMDTIKQVCLVNNKYIANGPRNALRGAEHQQQLQYLNVTDTADAGELLGFEVCVVLSSCAVMNFSVVFIMVVFISILMKYCGPQVTRWRLRSTSFPTLTPLHWKRRCASQRLRKDKHLEETD